MRPIPRPRAGRTHQPAPAQDDEEDRTLLSFYYSP